MPAHTQWLGYKETRKTARLETLLGGEDWERLDWGLCSVLARQGVGRAGAPGRQPVFGSEQGNIT